MEANVIILKTLREAYNRPDLEVEYVSEQDRVVFKAGKQEGITELMEWLRAFAERGGKIPLSTVIEDLEVHSPYGKYGKPKSGNRAQIKEKTDGEHQK